YRVHRRFFFFLLFRPPPSSTLFPYTTLFRSRSRSAARRRHRLAASGPSAAHQATAGPILNGFFTRRFHQCFSVILAIRPTDLARSEEHTSELQSRGHLVCRLLLEKKKIKNDK